MTPVHQPDDHIAVWTIGPVSTREVLALAKPPRKRRKKRPSRPEETRMNLHDDQKVAVSVAFRTRAGNPIDPATVGSLTFTSSDESILTVTDNGDGTAEVVTTGTLGDALVKVENDRDDDGTADFTGSLAVSVVAGDVFAIEVLAGEPVTRFEDAPPVEPEPEPEPTVPVEEDPGLPAPVEDDPSAPPVTA